MFTIFAGQRSVKQYRVGCESSKKTRRRFGIWLITGKQAFFDRRIWREDGRGYEVLTPFQRRAGVRYPGLFYPRFPDAVMGFSAFSARSRHRSMPQLFKGYFHSGPVIPAAFALRKGYRAVLARATGYVIVSTPRLRQVSSPGVVFVGLMRIGEREYRDA